MLLEVKDLNIFYGGIHALKSVSLQVNEGEIVTLIGANGAGKSTLLKGISGMVKAKTGSVLFRGRELLSLKSHQIVAQGSCHVPEGRRVFPGLSVDDNLTMGAYLRKDNKVEVDRQKVFDLFPRLAERRSQLAGTLSGGEQQMLAMGRGLMSNPILMLMDEPSMGLAPLLVTEIFRIIRDINEAGTTILLVEQNARMALSVAQSAYVLETGRIVLQGPAKDLAHNEKVQQAYLGG